MRRLHLVAAALSAMALEATSEAVRPGGAVTLVLETGGDSYPSHAALALFATFENGKGGDTRAEIASGPQCGSLRFRIRGPKGEFSLDYLDESRPLSHNGIAIAPNVACDKKRLSPGDHWTVRVHTAYDPERLAFLLAEPGDYTVVAHYSFAGVELQSEPARLSVTAPLAGERRAFEAFSPEVAVQAQVPPRPAAPAVGGTLAVAAAFAEEFPRSAYTDSLVPGLKAAIAAARSRSEWARLAPEAKARCERVLALPDPIPDRGPERAAYDALTPQLELIIHDGEFGSTGEARLLPAAAYAEALDYTRRFAGATYAQRVRFKLELILKARPRAPEESALLDDLQQRR